LGLGRAGTDGVLELEAELGACRERCKELEWKLTRVSTSLEHQNRELSHAREALARVQAAKAEEAKEMRRAHRRELDEMIVIFEKRRSDWAPRAATKLATADSGGATPITHRDKMPPYADPKSKDSDFFNYLEKFQKQTEQLRHHLDPSASAVPR